MGNRGNYRALRAIDQKSDRPNNRNPKRFPRKFPGISRSYKNPLRKNAHQSASPHQSYGGTA
jgi:hypothetical protein